MTACSRDCGSKLMYTLCSSSPREVLRVSVPQEVVFKFDCPLSSWALRLVDQTTATELPSSLQSSQLYLLNNNTVSTSLSTISGILL